MSTESLWIQNIQAQYAHLPLATKREQFLQHKLDEGSSWSSLRQTALYTAGKINIRLDLHNVQPTVV